MYRNSFDAERALDAYPEVLNGCDTPWAVSIAGGDRTPTDVDLVTEAVALSQRFGRPVATPDEAAQILGLPRERQ